MDEKESKMRYILPFEGELPIVASSPYLDTEKRVPTQEDLQQLKECGFNMVHLTVSSAFYEPVLNAFKDEGDIYVLIWNSNLQKEDSTIKNTIKDVNSPALAGYSLPDEPKVGEFKDDSTLYYCYSTIKKYDDQHLIYINLLGGSKEEYENYVNQFQKVFHPSFFSYDLYPITKNNCSVIGSFQSGFYYDLELYSNLARATGTPFWVFVQSMAWMHGDMEHYHPEATLAMIRFEVFASLGYGAQGISYWTYHQRPWSIKYNKVINDKGEPEEVRTIENINTKGSEIYFSALLDLEDKKTASWHYAKKVNEEVKRYTDVFLGCTCEECKHVFENAEYDSAKNPESILKRITNYIHVGPLSYVTANANGIQISRLSNNGRKYLLIVNRDILNFQMVEFHFYDDFKIYELTPLTSTATPIPNEQIAHSIDIPVTRTMPPGGYIIFRYE